MCACWWPEQHAWQTVLQARRRAGVAQRNRQGHAARGSDLLAPRCRALSDLGGTGGPGGGARTSAATEPSLATEATCQPSGSQATQAPIAACSLHPAQRGL